MCRKQMVYRNDLEYCIQNFVDGPRSGDAVVKKGGELNKTAILSIFFQFGSFQIQKGYKTRQILGYERLHTWEFRL